MTFLFPSTDWDTDIEMTCMMFINAYWIRKDCIKSSQMTLHYHVQLQFKWRRGQRTWDFVPWAGTATSLARWLFVLSEWQRERLSNATMFHHLNNFVKSRARWLYAIISTVAMAYEYSCLPMLLGRCATSWRNVSSLAKWLAATRMRGWTLFWTVCH